MSSLWREEHAAQSTAIGPVTQDSVYSSLGSNKEPERQKSAVYDNINEEHWKNVQKNVLSLCVLLTTLINGIFLIHHFLYMWKVSKYVLIHKIGKH